MNQEGDDLVTRLTKLFAFLLVLILSFPQVLAAEAAEPFSKDALSIPSLDEDTAIYAGTWVADSEEQAFLLLGNEFHIARRFAFRHGFADLVAAGKKIRPHMQLNHSVECDRTSFCVIGRADSPACRCHRNIGQMFRDFAFHSLRDHGKGESFILLQK